MDHQSNLTNTVVSDYGTIQCDQAIFTSIRSPTGQGYRIVAVSGGVRAEEKVEITRRSPSHGNLCDSLATSQAISGYPLPSGRYCIASSRYAGIEPSARGGLRIYTHAVLLDSTDYLHVEHDLISIFAALSRAVESSPMQTPPPQLVRVSLRIDPVGQSPTDWPLGSGEADDQTHTQIIKSLLADRCLILVGAKRPVTLLQQILAGLPQTIREKLALSVGLKFSSSRRMQLCLIDQDNRRALRKIRSHNITVLDLESLRPR